MKSLRRYAFAVILAASILSFLPALVFFPLRGQRIAGSAFIDGLSVGGWPSSRAEAALRERAGRHLVTPITLVSDSRAWSLSPRALGVRIDWRAPLRECLARGRRGWLGARVLALAAAPRRPLRLRLPVRVDARRLTAALAAEIASEVEFAPANAYYDRAAGAIVPARAGRRIALQATARNIIRAATAAGPARRARLVLRPVPPATPAHALAGLHLSHLIASYATALSGSPPERLANIRLAARVLHGTLVRPGRVFSFNAALGPRSLARGYRRAPEIVRRELVPGIGGGVCQVATTLYNAVLIAGLPVVERTCHSLPPGYVPLGRDATVYYPGLDLKFRNTSGGHLMVLAAVEGRTLRLGLLGEKPVSRRVWLVSQVLARLEPPVVAPGDPRATKNSAGAPGYRVRVARLYGDPERPSRIEIISEDVYHPVPRVRGAEAGRTPAAAPHAQEPAAQRRAAPDKPPGGEAAAEPPDEADAPNLPPPKNAKPLA
ncbi:MAG: VanW family protein [Patescibacteria group bacterium]